MRPGIPLAVAALPPLHEFYLHRTMPRRRLPVIAPQCATRYSAKPILLGRRLSAARLASYRPNETRKLTRDRSDGDRLELASPDQRSVAPVETALRLPGDLALWRRCRDLLLFGNANTGRMLIAPGALHERASRSPIARLRDGTAFNCVPGRTLRRPHAQISHQLWCGLKAREIAELGQQARRRDQIDAAQGHQRGDHLGQRPVRHGSADRWLQPLHTFLCLADCKHHFFEDDAPLRLLELLARQPVHVRVRPRLLARRIPAPLAQQECGHLLALRAQINHRGLARSREITHRLVPAVRNPHRGQLAGTQQLRQVDGITSVGLHSIAPLLRDQRWRNHNALMAECFDLSMELVTRGTCLVAECDPLVFGFELTNQLGRRRGAVLDLAQKTNFTRPTAIRNRNRITQLRGIQRHESFAMLAHDSPSLLEALPGPSG